MKQFIKDEFKCGDYVTINCDYVTINCDTVRDKIGRVLEVDHSNRPDHQAYLVLVKDDGCRVLCGSYLAKCASFVPKIPEYLKNNEL